ncbi:resolvase [Candidatus Woesearchaeota archaeon]|nr:MAG: resolvase [Candidatus Woesearchaeota archaeon]
MQLKELRDYCQRMKYDIYREYTDIGESGAKTSRPQFNLFMEDMRKRLFDAVLVWKLDRMGRSLLHLLQIMEELKTKNIDFISYSQNLNTMDSTGKLLFNIIGSFAEFERDIIRERVLAGKRKSVIKQGRKPLQINRHEVHRLREEGKTLEQIGDEVGCSYGTVYNLLRMK